MLSSAARQLESYQSETLFNAPNTVNAFDILRSSFERAGALSDGELDLVRDLTREVRYHPVRKNLWLPGAAPPPSRILVSGWACRYRMTAGGERQIMCLLLPGNFTTPPLEPRLPSSCGVAALTEVETVSAQALVDGVGAASNYPNLARAVQYAVNLQDILLCEQISRLTQQGAEERILHFMLELRDRLRRPGSTSEDAFTLPLTQEILANLLGLSAVHLNRSLQALRKAGKLEFGRGRVILPQHKELQSMALRIPSHNF